MVPLDSVPSRLGFVGKALLGPRRLLLVFGLGDWDGEGLIDRRLLDGVEGEGLLPRFTGDGGRLEASDGSAAEWNEEEGTGMGGEDGSGERGDVR